MKRNILTAAVRGTACILSTLRRQEIRQTDPEHLHRPK